MAANNCFWPFPHWSIVLVTCWSLIDHSLSQNKFEAPVPIDAAPLPLIVHPRSARAVQVPKVDEVTPDGSQQLLRGTALTGYNAEVWPRCARTPFREASVRVVRDLYKAVRGDGGVIEDHVAMPEILPNVLNYSVVATRKEAVQVLHDLKMKRYEVLVVAAKRAPISLKRVHNAFEQTLALHVQHDTRIHLECWKRVRSRPEGTFLCYEVEHLIDILSGNSISVQCHNPRSWLQTGQLEQHQLDGMPHFVFAT
mmetsp:Transcript_88338/g.248825  ORF Transcript_88338/g.248825 Transcript_88338/m.248825 type:complete len:253 (+) Transcript_88338:28-786(+)